MWPPLVLAALTAGEHDLARRLLAPVESARSGRHSPAVAAQWHRLRGLVAGARGDDLEFAETELRGSYCVVTSLSALPSAASMTTLEARHLYPREAGSQQRMDGDDHVAATYGPVFAAAPDATGGALDLDLNEVRVAHAPVIDLVDTPDLLADALELPWRGAFRHGFCWGILVPDEKRVLVVLMGHAGPDLDGPGAVIGRLPDQDARRFLDLWGGRAARVSLLIEATPGMLGIEVRYRTLAVSTAPVSLVAAVTPAMDGMPTDVIGPEIEVESRGVVEGVPALGYEPPAEPEPEPELVDVPEQIDVPQVELIAEPELVDVPGTEPVPQPVPDHDPEPVPLPVSEVVAESEPEPVVVDPLALTPPSPVAGWYVDPFDAAAWRWWDGSQWSTDTAPQSPEDDPTD